MKMVVVGDGRAASDGVGPSAYWAGILAEAAILEPDFILHTGDFVKNGKRLDEWQRYLRSLPPWPPIIGVRGNHDRGSLFAELGIGLGEIFALRLGPALLVGLDSEVPAARFQALLDELDRLLSRSTGTWKIVMLHRPIWSQGNHGSDERGFNERLVPILDRNQVDLVLSGHDHNYERFCPSRGVGLNRTCADDGNGTTYIVTGGAATFTNHWPGMSRRVDSATAREDAQASRVFSGSKHFVELDVGPDQLVLTARRTRTGNFRGPGVIDRFVLNRKSDCVP
jgi:predicted phosphodiesterase